APPTGVVRPPKTRQEWMQQAAELSESAVPLVLQQVNLDETAMDVTLMRRFGKALNLDKRKFEKLMIDATEETRTLSNNAQLKSPLLDDKKEIQPEEASSTTDTQAEEDVLSGLFLPDVEEEKSMVTEYHPSGKPFNAQEQLLAGVQEITELMATRDYKINDLFLLVLEVLYNSLGFRYVTICLKDIKTNQYRSRYSLGENNAEIQRNFIFPTSSSTDIFSLSIKRDVDLMISDASTKKVRDMIPRWHRSLLTDARSFIVLPLVVNERPIGLFYADRKQVAPEGITADEMKIIKTLKRQVMTALSTR
ncbi:MAG: histidine kinase, partial [Nitrosomonas sp.]|nr:histidine kinase [Nitrosomonas sp.]